MKYSHNGRDQSLVAGSGRARALLVGAEKYDTNSSKVMFESEARSFCADCGCEGWKTREIQLVIPVDVEPGSLPEFASLIWTRWVLIRKDLKALTESLSCLAWASKMPRSSLRIIGEVILRGVELAPRLATPPPAPWGEVVSVAIEDYVVVKRGCSESGVSVGFL